MSREAESIRETYRRFADEQCHGYSPLYDTLARGVAEDDTLIRFVARLPDPQPNLLFAAVQYLTGPEHVPADATGLRRFLDENAGAVDHLARTRRTQTNEIGRCTAFLPALPDGPLALLEVGASAGLCLLLDRFRYAYDGVELGPADSPVRLRCRTEGAPVPVPAAVPTIAWRGGLDLQPVRLEDPDQVRWLLACVWADHPERRARLEAAIGMARARAPEVVRGDLVDDLWPLVREAPEGSTLVVLQSAVFPYLRPERREAFRRLLLDVSRERDLVWITGESPGLVQGLEGRPPERVPRRFQLGRTSCAGGGSEAETLAWTHPHGWDIDWIA